VTVVLEFPHDTNSHQPLMLSTRDVWRLGEEARAQLDAGSVPCMTFTHVAARTRTLRINGLELETCWAFEPELRDDRNRSVMGVIEFDPEVPRTALMSLNSTALAGREDVTMSTAAHEFGHAIFDAPGWMVAAERQAVKDAEATRRFRSVVRGYRSAKPLNISEWRANEFMGAFLAPPKLLRWQMTRIMRELKLPKKFGADGGLVLDADRVGFAEVDTVVDELATAFGLSIGFIEYRLVRYGIAPRASR